MMSIESN